jgi:integrase
MARIAERNGKLLFDFSYMGLRCREQTTLTDSKENRMKLNAVLKKIQAKIELGIFEYREYFPNSKNADKIEKLDLQRRFMTGKATPKFEEFAEKWFKTMEPTWRTNTILGYRNYYQKRILPYWHGQEVSGITRQDIMEFRSHVAKLTNEKTGDRLEPSTVNKTLKIFRMIINEAADQYEFTSPYRNIQMLKEPKKEIQPFNLVEVRQIIDNIQLHFRIYVLVRFFTGLRTGEINGLRWKNVDFDHRVIKVRETYSEKTGFEYTKNDSSQRDIQMSALVYEALKEHFDQTYFGDDELTVFSSPETNNPVHNNNFRKRAWVKVLKELGLAYRNPYQTRHTTATLWLGAGENASWIARQMGHTSTEMLFTTYARYVPNLTRQDGSAFESMLQDSYPNEQVPDLLENHLVEHEETSFDEQFLQELLTSKTQENYHG